jgi:hypothetical protein|tara:strand:+ start:34644 stop:34850 length:207 start_codon:yes stop_codon:yes gene_type:complete
MDKEKLLDFLMEDLKKLKINVEILIDYVNNYLGNTLEKDYNDKEKENPIDEIDNFFWYWEQHIKQLKK